MDQIFFFDNNSTTQTDERVVEAMTPFFTGKYANAASAHVFGIQVNKEIEKAKDELGTLLKCNPADLIFTSGATESINLAIKGYALKNVGRGNHIITVATEHKAVIETCQYLESIGFELTYVPVNPDGTINLSQLRSAIKKTTILISAMWVNNEIGTIHPIEEIATIARENNVAFFSDITQAVGKIEIDLGSFPIEMAAFSGHKFYGPKGIGVLYVKDLKKNKNNLLPLMHGGGHQSGLRSGTLNVPAIIGIGKAAQLVRQEMATDKIKIEKYRDLLESELLKIPNAFINGLSPRRIYNVTNICFPEQDASVMIQQLNNICVSNGSACTSAIVEPSHVLTALGLKDDDALSALRFSLGKFNTEEEVKYVAGAVKKLLIKASVLNT